MRGNIRKEVSAAAWITFVSGLQLASFNSDFKDSVLPHPCCHISDVTHSRVFVCVRVCVCLRVCVFKHVRVYPCTAKISPLCTYSFIQVSKSLKIRWKDLPLAWDNFAVSNANHFKTFVESCLECCRLLQENPWLKCIRSVIKCNNFNEVNKSLILKSNTRSNILFSFWWLDGTKCIEVRA